MITIEEAWGKISSVAKSLPSEIQPISDVLGCVLRESVKAPIDIPPFNNSAMDGYALRATDTTSASEQVPLVFPVLGEIAAGTFKQDEVQRGTAIKIMTGAPLPEGTDSVLMLEAGRLRDGKVEVRSPLAQGKHVRRRGEDVPKGEVILDAGCILNAQRIGLLANSGISAVSASRQLNISILATGSELAQTGSPLKPGQIYDSNRIVLKNLIKNTGSRCKDIGVALDDESVIKRKIKEGLDADILVISGGVSVGSHDYVKQVLDELGMDRLFWRVKMKPGKPILCGRIGNTWVFGLPGNPVSCVVGFLVFIEPLIRLLLGEENVTPRFRKAILNKKVTKNDSRRTFITAKIDQNSDAFFEATPTVQQGSAMMRALSDANGFVIVPEERQSIELGEKVDVLVFGE